VFVCMRRHQNARQGRGTGEGPGEIGGSSIEIITLHTGGEGSEDGNCDGVYRSTASFHSIVILLFIYLFLSSSLFASRPFLRTAPLIRTPLILSFNTASTIPVSKYTGQKPEQQINTVNTIKRALPAGTANATSEFNPI
jgi:hypothetical protein